ncbi:MAG: ABC transporter ATP-binding protein [Planctomycetes bacterium]|nr:ABC transporter ATP-binding protein [Planctomycetota bacterium]
MTASESAVGLGVKVRAVAHAFDGAASIEHADFAVSPGGFLAIVGDSGGGKTTLLRLIGGLLGATSGTIEYVDGQGGRVSPGVRDISFCFQEGRLLPWRNVLDNVALPLELAGASASERRGAAREMLATMRLADAECKMPAQLSGGMRMRVAMARALVTHPKLLLLDEPFGALDEVTRLALDEELRRLWRQSGTTAILVTHSIQEAVSLAQMVVVMKGKPGRTLPPTPIRLSMTEGWRTSMEFVSLCQNVYQQMTRNCGEPVGGVR